MDGEKDPRNLLTAFNTVISIATKMDISGHVDVYITENLLFFSFSLQNVCVCNSLKTICKTYHILLR